MADDTLDQDYIRTRQGMRKWQQQMFEMEPSQEGTTVHMGAQIGGKPQEGALAQPTAQTTAPTPPTPPPIPSPVAPGPYEETIQQEAAKHKVDPNLLRAVMQEESGGRPEAVSPKGAMGLMQLMPDTAAEAGVTDALDPIQNIAGGAKLLGQLLTKFEGDKVKALAAYNFGRGNVVKGKPYPKETKAYIEKILSHLPLETTAEAAPTEAPPEEAAGITPRREFTVDTPEAQALRQHFKEKTKPWVFDLDTFDVPGDVLRAGLAKLSGVERGEKEGQLRMSSDEMVARVFFKYGDKPEEVIKQAEKLGMDEAQTLKVMAGLSAVVLGAVMDPLNVLRGGKGKDAAKVGEVLAAEAAVPLYKAAAGKKISDDTYKAAVERIRSGDLGPPRSSFFRVQFKAGGHQDANTMEEAEVLASISEGSTIHEVLNVDPSVKQIVYDEFKRAADILKSERGSVPLGPAARIGGPAEEPLSGKQLALLSKREESKQKARFTVEGFEKELLHQTRRTGEGGVLSDEAIQKLAAESGFTLQDLLDLKPGSILAPELQLAARAVYSAAGKRTKISAQTYLAMPTTENLDEFIEAFVEGGVATTRIVGTFTEGGRTFRYFNRKVPGMAPAGEYGARDPVARIQDPYIQQMVNFYRNVEAKSKMGGFAGPHGQPPQPGVVTPGQLASMVVELPSEEAIMNFAKNALKPTWSDMIFEMWVNGLLSSFATQTVNFMSNSTTIVWGIGERAVASMLHPRTIRPSEPLAMTAAIFEGQLDAWKIAWKAFKEDKPQFGHSKFDVPMRAITADALELTGTPGRAIDYLWVAMGGDQGGWLNKTGTGLRLPGRTMLAGDEYFKSIAARVELRALGKRRAFQEINELGLTGKEAAKTAKEIEKRILDNPPEPLKEAMQEFASYVTYTRDLEQVGQAVQHLAQVTPMGRFIAPFIRTAGNIFKYAAERTPIAGLALLDHVPGVKHIPVVRTLARGVADLPGMHSVAEELRAGGERAALAQAKIALGSMTMGAVAMLVANRYITGGGPKDKRLRKQWEDEGWQPYSIFPEGMAPGKEGFSYLGYFEPLSSLIGMSADATEIIGQLDNADADTLASALVVIWSRDVANKTMVKGVAGTLNAVTSQDVNVWKSFLEKEAPTLLPYSSLLKKTAKIVDPSKRDVRNILDAYMAAIPGWSSSLEAEHNLWGEVKPQKPAVGPDFISNIYSTVFKDDPVIHEMNRLKHFFDLPSRYVGGLKNVPNKTYWRYVDLAAGRMEGDRTLHDTIADTMFGSKADLYKGATPDYQIALIQADIDRYRRHALRALRNENPAFDQEMTKQEMKTNTRHDAAQQAEVLAAPQLR